MKPSAWLVTLQRNNYGLTPLFLIFLILWHYEILRIPCCSLTQILIKFFLNRSSFTVRGFSEEIGRATLLMGLVQHVGKFREWWLTDTGIHPWSLQNTNRSHGHMRLRGKIIRTAPCCVVQDSCAQQYAHTCEQFLQFSGLGFVTLGPFHCAQIYLCLSVCFCFILYICTSTVSTVEWT